MLRFTLLCGLGAALLVAGACDKPSTDAPLIQAARTGSLDTITRLLDSGVDVNLPKTSGKPTTVEERMVLTLSKDHNVYLNEKLIPMASLEQTLIDLFKNRQDKTIYLRADQALQYGFVVETMDRVRRSGIEKLGMVTEPTRAR